MVNYREAALDRTFSALSDATRRALVARLSRGDGVSVSELARPLDMSLPAVMKHLDVLADAGLIAREKAGRTVTCRLTAATMKSAMDWLNKYERFWSEGLDRLAAYLEEDQSWPPQQQRPNRASSSSAGSTPRRPKSSRRGPNRKN